MADEVEIPTARVDDVADARNALWRCATELKAISGAEVIVALAEGLNQAAAALDEFVAELAAERLGEFPVNRWPKGDVAEVEPAELVESDEAAPVDAPDAPDPARNDVPPDAEPEDAPQEGDSEDGPEDAPAPDHDALVIRARKHKIKGYTKMSDAELAEAVAKAEAS